VCAAARPDAVKKLQGCVKQSKQEGCALKFCCDNRLIEWVSIPPFGKRRGRSIGVSTVAFKETLPDELRRIIGQYPPGALVINGSNGLKLGTPPAHS
jgi:hypothetical protein